MTHRGVRKLLYEYLRGELNVKKEVAVAQHLSACDECSAEMKLLGSAIEAVNGHLAHPADVRSQEFWSAFAFRVEERIRQHQPRKRGGSVSAIIGRMLVLNRRMVILGGSGLAVAAALLIAIEVIPHSGPQQERPEFTSGPPVREDVQVEPASDRLHQYFRRSKVLLVGIANMDVEEKGPVDFSAERRLSRDLIQEARYLQTQPIDRRSERLIGDLEKILIELANMKEHDEMPNVEMIRGGIHNENLLFKIRMAESMFDTSHVMSAIERN